MDKQQIIADIEAAIARSGRGYSSWYVGISKRAHERLVFGHGVRKGEGDVWIVCPAPSAAVAREVEDYFVRLKGTDGGPGGGDETADMVYAYLKEAHTNP